MLDWGLAEAAAAVRKRQISSVELTQACLDRIAKVDGHVNSFIAVRRETALAEARSADQALANGMALGPLHGVPIAHKDMFHQAGEISTFGSHPRNHVVARHTATVLARLSAAGAISLGTLNMAEFASNPTGHNVHCGDCRNPWNTAHVTGGSSSGSAAAVATRLVYGSLGSDTGGSIRLPAAFCGITGLKPTHTRVSRFGALPLAPSFDAIGPLARTAADCALLLCVIAGFDQHDPTCSPRAVPDYSALPNGSIRGLRVGIAEEYFFDDIANDVGVRIQEAIAEFASLGADVRRVAVPNMVAANAFQIIMHRTEASMLHSQLLRSQYVDYDPQVRELLEAGLAIPATLYAEAMGRRGPMLSAVLHELFGKVDVVLTPTVGIGAPTLTDTAYSSGTRPALLRNISSCTRPITYLGLPCISIPCGFDSKALPVAFQLVGAPFRELTVLRAAHAYQQVTNWHRVIPQVTAPTSVN